MRSRLVAVLRVFLVASSVALTLTLLGAAQPPTARADCPPGGTWFGPPNINRYADGQCGFIISGFTVPFLPVGSNQTINSFSFSGSIVQEAGVNVFSNGSIVTQAGTTWTDVATGDPTSNNGLIQVLGSGDLEFGAGTTIQIVGGWRIVAEGGTLNFNGTQAQPVVVTSAAATPAPGDWGRIEYRNGSAGAMTFTNLSFGGLNVFGSCSNSCSILSDNRCGGPNCSPLTSPSMSNVTVDHSLGNGIEIIAATPTLSGVTLTNNGGAAVRYDNLADLSAVSGLTASGNGQNVLSMQGGGTSSPLTWPNVGVPIAVTGNVNIFDGSTFTIKPGVTVELNGGEFIEVSGSNAAISWVGTPNQPIVFTSANVVPAAGDWGAIRLESGMTGTMAFVTVQFGGASVPGFGPTELFVDAANPTIRNTVFQNSAGDDVQLRDNAQPTLQFNWFLKVPSGFFGVNNLGSTMVTAVRNFWGSPTGPTSPNNPGGTGTPVSTNVSFRPWLGLTVSPTSGSPGSTATVTGTGYKPNETVKVRWNCSIQRCAANTIVLATVTANSNGAFTTSVQIPTSAVAGQTVTIGAVGQSSQAIAQASFKVT